MEGGTNVFLFMNVTVIRNSDNLVNTKSGIWREEKVYMAWRPDRTLGSFARIPRDVEMIVHRELLRTAMVTAQCMHT